MTHPGTATRFMRGALGFNEWLIVAGTGFLGYKFGYAGGYVAAGDYKKINHHFGAYYLIKTQNRYEGRVNLMKKPIFLGSGWPGSDFIDFDSRHY